MKQLIFLLFFCFTISNSLNADDTIVAVTENWKPFNYVENGIVKGASTEIVRAVLDESDIKYTITVFPWARSYMMALSHENILIYSLIRSPRREELFHWVGPVSDSDQIAFYKLSTREDIVLESLDQAKRYRIGLTKDSPLHGHLIDLGFDESLIDIVALDQLANIKKLLLGRIDILPASEQQFKYAINEAGFEEETFEKVLPLFNLSPYMALSRKSPEDLVMKIRDSYNSLVAEGRIRKFKQ